jgi:hypothetical protein
MEPRRSADIIGAAPWSQGAGRYPGWYRHITLAMLAHAFLAAMATPATVKPRAPAPLIDCGNAAGVLKTHSRNPHRTWRIRPTPGWARPLLLAAAAHHQLRARPADAALFPVITTREGTELTAHATACGLSLIGQNNPRTRRQGALKTPRQPQARARRPES